MPIYFFDVQDAQGLHPDDIGLDLPDMDAALHEARRALADMSREILSRSAVSDQDLRILIRDHGEGPILIALTITTDRPDGSDGADGADGATLPQPPRTRG